MNSSSRNFNNSKWIFNQNIILPRESTLCTGDDFGTENESGGWDAGRVDVLELTVEHGLFQHAQKDDSSDPKLNSEQIPPVFGADDEPDDAHGDVDATHDAVEGQQRVVHDAQVAVLA